MEEADFTLPAGIGPHEERELELMLSGEKPLAMFSEITGGLYAFPDAEFEPYVQSGRIVKRDYHYPTKICGKDFEFRFLYFALPEEEWRIDALHDVQYRTFNGERETDEMTAEKGRLLGYSEADITAFLAWISRPSSSRNARSSNLGWPGVGPHEGKELDLMLAGKKPLAYFSEPVASVSSMPEGDFEPYVQTGALVKGDYLETVKGQKFRYLYYAVPEEAGRIKQAHDFHLKTAELGGETEEEAYFIGRLLGYTDEEIAGYVTWRNATGFDLLPTRD